MREAVFLRNNEKKWLTIESKIADGFVFTTDELVTAFSDLGADLSYARTNYPSSKSTVYLNELNSHLYRGLYKKDTSWKKKFLVFWTYDLPLQLFNARKELLLSALFFFFSIFIGVVSTHFDPEFPKIILGEEYVETTMKNIENGNPMAIYDSQEEELMFFRITLNNIMVALRTFVVGIFFGIGTYLFLFINGIMLGSFQYFFYQKGLFLTSFLTIWIHGTIEISSIVIAGAAGIVVGNSFLFPGAKTRVKSLIKGTKRACKIAIGLIPLFIIAGFLESFITRHTEWPTYIKAGIILLSLAFIIYYFIIYPWLLFRQRKTT